MPKATQHIRECIICGERFYSPDESEICNKHKTSDMNLKPFSVRVIPHWQQIYDCCGDYTIKDKDGNLVFTISDLRNADMEFLIMIHELIEYQLMKKRGITVKSVIDFDKQFEKDRLAGLHNDTEEPGDHPDAPYRKEHHFAEQIERQVAFELGVDWEEYGKKIEKLDYYSNPKNQTGRRG